MDEPQVKMGFEGRQGTVQASIGDDLWEMHAAGTKIVEFTAGRGLSDFVAYEALRAAVRSMLSLMGAALERLVDSAPETAAKLDGPDLLELCARMDAAGDEEVWGFIQAALPELLARTEAELAAWHEG